jgi:hypothetical protein
MPRMDDWDAIQEQLMALRWPEEFLVEYTDGKLERLLRGEGVSLHRPADAPDGIGGFSADLPKKHPRNKQIGRQVSYREVQAIRTLSGETLWTRRE